MRNPCVAAASSASAFAIRRQQDDPAVGAEHTQRADEILTADRIEHEVDALRPFLEPLGAEVDHLVGTQAAHELGVFTRRGGDHVASERFGDLHGMMSHPAGTAVNQHAGARTEPPRPHERLPGRQRGLRRGRGLLKGDVLRLEREVRRRHGSELGVGAPGREIDRPEHRIADTELLHAFARFRYDPRKVPTENHRARSLHRSGQSFAAPRPEVDPVDSGSLYRNQHFAPRGHRGGNRGHGELLRPPESFENHRSHIDRF